MDYQYISPNVQLEVPSEDAIIDAHGIWNDAKKVNHHCEPNSWAVEGIRRRIRSRNGKCSFPRRTGEHRGPKRGQHRLR